MKVVIIIFVLILAIFLIFQIYMFMSVSKTETQKYTVIRKYKDFEIRFYPSATLASIKSNASTYRELSGSGFSQLAGYIFGGNESEAKISMTSPVHMDINDSGSTMSFVMPSSYNETNLPVPNDPNVIIYKTADEYVAVIGFGGFASENDLKFYSEKLQNLLKKEGINPLGHYRYLGYNPPFQLTGRKNEIIVSVEWKEK